MYIPLNTLLQRALPTTGSNSPVSGPSSLTSPSSNTTSSAPLASDQGPSHHVPLLTILLPILLVVLVIAVLGLIFWKMNKFPGMWKRSESKKGGDVENDSDSFIMPPGRERLNGANGTAGGSAVAQDAEKIPDKSTSVAKEGEKRSGKCFTGFR